MEESGSQEQHKLKPRSKSILKQATVVSRSERLQLRALAESLRLEFEPQNPFEQFLFEKLVTDICRLAKLYEYERSRVFGREYGLGGHLEGGESDRFIRYKNSIEKDIKDGHFRLEELKNARECA